MNRKGFVQVCEHASADWLPFKEIYVSETTRGKRTGKKFIEGTWNNSKNNL